MRWLETINADYIDAAMSINLEGLFVTGSHVKRSFVRLLTQIDRKLSCTIGRNDTKNLTSDGSKSDPSSSKYLWISNLPQGVRAVDIKEMCAPYGKVSCLLIL